MSHFHLLKQQVFVVSPVLKTNNFTSFWTYFLILFQGAKKQMEGQGDNPNEYVVVFSMDLKGSHKETFFWAGRHLF